MPMYLRVLLVVGWVVWFLPFVEAKRKTSPAATQPDPRARWGMLLQAVAFLLVWWRAFQPQPEAWRITAAAIFFLLAALLSWSSTRALGRHFRVDAGLNPDHELVRAGPYGIVRHPIYTSVLCMVLGTGILSAPPGRLLLATMLCIAGTEIRVRVEDALLASRFGDAFGQYRRAVRAYLPFLR